MNTPSFEALLTAVERTATDLCQKGWAERNAGNISIRLKPDEVDPYFMSTSPAEPLGVEAPHLATEHFLITCSGSFMRNIAIAPSDNTGVIRIGVDGKTFQRVWGFGRGAGPTSELPSHIRAHEARFIASSGEDRIIMHTHALNVIALTNAFSLDSASLTRLLWESHSECIVVFPDGIALLPWLVPGGDELADATAKALETRRMVVWPIHGILASGPDLDSVFGLIDTADKASAIYLASSAFGPPRNKLSREQLELLAKQFNLKPDLDAMAIK